MNGLATASFFGFGALLVLFGANANDIIRDFELDYADFGLVASIFSIGIGSGILCGGPIADRLPRRPLFALSCAGVAIATFGLGPSIGFGALLVLAFSIGFGAGFYETVLNAVIVEQSRDQAARRLLFVHAAATLGASVTPFAIGLLRAPLALDWVDSFRAAGVFHLLLGCGLPFLPNRPTPVVESERSPRMTLVPGAGASGRLLLSVICAVTFIYVGVETSLTFFVADYARSQMALAPARSSEMIGFFWIGLLLGRLAVGLVPRPPNAALTAILALLASVTLSAFLLGWGALPELALTSTGFALGGVFPIMIGLAGVSRPDATGSSVALAAGLGSVGGFTIPWLTGILATRTSLSIALLSLAVWLVLLAAACGIVHRYPRRLRR